MPLSCGISDLIDSIIHTLIIHHRNLCFILYRIDWLEMGELIVVSYLLYLVVFYYYGRASRSSFILLAVYSRSEKCSWMVSKICFIDWEEEKKRAKAGVGDNLPHVNSYLDRMCGRPSLKRAFEQRVPFIYSSGMKYVQTMPAPSTKL